MKQPLLSVRNVLTGEVLISDAPMNNGSSGTVVPASQFDDATVRASAVGGTGSITATVTMMCGCPITVVPPLPPPPGTELYWPPSEFEVTAQIRSNGGLNVVSLPLTCSSTSTFTGSTTLQPGAYDVWVVAVQPKEANVGFARTTLVVT